MRGPVDPRLLRHARASRGGIALLALIGIGQALATIAIAVSLCGIVTGIAAEVAGTGGTLASTLTTESAADRGATWSEAVGRTLDDALGVTSGGTLSGLFGGTIAWAIVLLGGAFAVRAGLAWAEQVVAQRTAARVIDELRRSLLDRVVGLGPAWVASYGSGRLTTVLGTGLDALRPWFSAYLPALGLGVLLPPLVVVIMAVVDPASAVVALLTLPLIPVLGALIGWATKARAERRWAADARLAGHFLDVVRGLSTLRMYGRAERQIDVIADLTDRHRRATLRVLRVAFLSSTALDLVGTLAVGLIAVQAGLRVAAGSMDLGPALLVILLAPEAYRPLREMAARYHASTDASAVIADVDEILTGQDSFTTGGAREHHRSETDSAHTAAAHYGPGTDRDHATTTHRAEGDARGIDRDQPASHGSPVHLGHANRHDSANHGLRPPDVLGHDGRPGSPRGDGRQPGTGKGGSALVQGDFLRAGGTVLGSRGQSRTALATWNQATSPGNRKALQDRLAATGEPKAAQAQHATTREPEAAQARRPTAGEPEAAQNRLGVAGGIVTAAGWAGPARGAGVSWDRRDPAFVFTGAAAGQWGVRVAGLRARYPGAFEDALSLADLSVRAGELVALRGPSGAGKTTALRVLAGLHPAEAGAIAVGSTFHLPQRPALPHARTVAEAFPVDTTAEEITAALDTVGLTGEVTAGTPLGEQVAGISAGQRQRLALAVLLHRAGRAVAERRTRDTAPVVTLLLDEPTAHLDSAAERLVIDRLHEFAALGCAVLVVAHRPALLAAADRVTDLRPPAGSDRSTGPRSPAGSARLVVTDRTTDLRSPMGTAIPTDACRATDPSLAARAATPVDAQPANTHQTTDPRLAALTDAHPATPFVASPGAGMPLAADIATPTDTHQHTDVPLIADIATPTAAGGLAGPRSDGGGSGSGTVAGADSVMGLFTHHGDLPGTVAGTAVNSVYPPPIAVTATVTNVGELPSWSLVRPAVHGGSAARLAATDDVASSRYATGIAEPAPEPAGLHAGATVPETGVAGSRTGVAGFGPQHAEHPTGDPAGDSGNLGESDESGEPGGHWWGRLRKPWVAAGFGAGSSLAGILLTGAAAWLLVRASSLPPVLSLSAAVVVVRGSAVARPLLRYLERLVAHDVAFARLGGRRAKVYADLIPHVPGPVLHRRGDLLTRLVDDVDATTDGLLRGRLPAAAAAVTAGFVLVAVAGTAPAVTVALVVGLLVAGLLAPAVAAWQADRQEAATGAARAALRDAVVETVDGVEELAGGGGRPGVPGERSRTLANLEARAARAAGLASAIAHLGWGATAAGAAVVLTRGGLSAEWSAVVLLGVIVLGETIVPLPEAAIARRRAAGAERRVAGLTSTRFPAVQRPGHDAAPATGRDGAARNGTASSVNNHSDKDNDGGVRDSERGADTGRGRSNDSNSGDSGSGSGSSRDSCCGDDGDGDGDAHAATGGIRRGSDNARARTGGMRGGSGAVLVAGLAAGWDPGTAPVLEGLELRLPAGSRTAIMGRSGCGKSTLAAVLAGLLPPRAGIVEVSGTAVLVGEETGHVFASTVRENLRLAAPAATDPQLLAVLRRVGLAGMDLGTWLGTGGSTISGGQRRRLATARALLADPALLILDEPTEGIDEAGARELMADLLDAASGRTVLVLAHRAEGLDLVDRVLDLEKSRLTVRTGRP